MQVLDLLSKLKLMGKGRILLFSSQVLSSILFKTKEITKNKQRFNGHSKISSFGGRQIGINMHKIKKCMSRFPTHILPFSLQAFRVSSENSKNDLFQKDEIR